MLQALAVNDDGLEDVSADVEAILADYALTDDSPTEIALSKGHAKTIIRDAANDDEASEAAIPA